jgi:hypothetical protein
LISEESGAVTSRSLLDEIAKLEQGLIAERTVREKEEATMLSMLHDIYAKMQNEIQVSTAIYFSTMYY